MKVLKYGKLKKITYIVICHECKSELEYTNEDIKFDKDGNYVICPVCKKFIAHVNLHLKE